MRYSDQMCEHDDPVTLYLSSLDSARSRETMRHALSSFSRYLHNSDEASYSEIQWSRITFRDLQLFVSFLIDDGKKENTISLYLSAIKGVLRKAATISSVDPDKRVSREVLAEITEQVRAPVVRGKRKMTFVSRADFKALLETFDNEAPASARDRAIFLLMYGCGLRRSEVVELTVPDSINWTQQHLVIKGKGNKRREIPMFAEVEDAILAWLETVRGEQPGPLFFRLSKSGRPLTDKSLTKDGIGDIVKRRCARAAIESYKPHDFRGTYATTLFQLDTDLFTVMKLMGHEDPSTTKLYDLRDGSIGHDAMVKLGEYISAA